MTGRVDGVSVKCPGRGTPTREEEGGGRREVRPVLNQSLDLERVVRVAAAVVILIRLGCRPPQKRLAE